MKFLGLNCRIECCILCLIVGIFIGTNLFCSCVTKEGMAAAGAVIDYSMREGNVGKEFGNKSIYNGADTYEKLQVPLPEGQLFLLANAKFDPKCCATSTISGSGGCACLTTEVNNYLRSHGGNATGGFKLQ